MATVLTARHCRYDAASMGRWINLVYLPVIIAFELGNNMVERAHRAECAYLPPARSYWSNRMQGSSEMLRGFECAWERAGAGETNMLEGYLLVAVASMATVVVARKIKAKLMRQAG
jgi:hypothetical protein